jgi:hypothetical protein
MTSAMHVTTARHDGCKRLTQCGLMNNPHMALSALACHMSQPFVTYDIIFTGTVAMLSLA